MESAPKGSWGKRPDMRVHDDEPFNAEPPRTALGASLLTPPDTFYSRNHGPIPHIEASTWQLRVDGLVETPLMLDLERLREFEAHTVTATLQCAGARRAGLIAVKDIPGEEPWDVGATSTARWTGARLSDVLASAGVRAEAEHVGFVAPDISDIPPEPQSFGGSITLEKALAPEVLLAWEMNGEPLPTVHGGPVRVVVPGYIGARSIKWVTHVDVRSTPSENYFQATAYRLLPPQADPASAGPGDGISLGPVALNSDVLHPEDGARVTPGALEIRGYAYAGEKRRIVRVDVSLDDGVTWQQAQLVDADGPWAWTFWETTVDVPAGPRVITVWAWDSSGATQPSDPAQLWNPKGYINNAWGRVHIVGMAPS